MIVAYYAGLFAVAVLMKLPDYFPEDEDWFSQAVVGAIAYLLWGSWLFGWMLGLANVLIVFLIANAISWPLDWVVFWTYPNARRRVHGSLESRTKMRRIGLKLGMNKHGQRRYPVPRDYPDDERDNSTPPHDLRRG